MDKIYMKYVANLFGLELGEPFTLLNSNANEDKNRYIFTEKGLEKSNKRINDIYEHTNNCDIILGNMLRGYYDIKKIPWKPANGQRYYIPSVENGCADFHWCKWVDNYKCESRYNSGLVCKTANEAVEKAEKMLAALKED